MNAPYKFNLVKLSNATSEEKEFLKTINDYEAITSGMALNIINDLNNIPSDGTSYIVKIMSGGGIVSDTNVAYLWIGSLTPLGSVEIQYCVHQKYRDLGIATSLIKQLILKLFKAGVIKIHAIVDLDNEKSQKVLIYNGFDPVQKYKINGSRKEIYEISR